jgi:hypothetical protein
MLLSYLRALNFYFSCCIPILSIRSFIYSMQVKLILSKFNIMYIQHLYTYTHTIHTLIYTHIQKTTPPYPTVRTSFTHIWARNDFVYILFSSYTHLSYGHNYTRNTHLRSYLNCFIIKDFL